MKTYLADNMVFEGPVLFLSGKEKYVETVKPLCRYHKSWHLHK